MRDEVLAFGSFFVYENGVCGAIAICVYSQRAINEWTEDPGRIKVPHETLVCLCVCVREYLGHKFDVNGQGIRKWSIESALRVFNGDV